MTIIEFKGRTDKADLLDISRLEDWEFAKHWLTMRFMSEADEIPEGVVTYPFADLIATYRVKMGEDKDGELFITLTKEHLKYYGITEEQLHADAMTSSPLVAPAVAFSLSEYLFGADAAEFGLAPAVVVTTEPPYFGASAILYDGVLDKVADIFGGDVLVLPSSVHEVITVPADMFEDIEDAKDMVRTINASDVAPEDKLSDNVYIYSAKARTFTLA